MQWEQLKSILDEILSFEQCNFSRARILNRETRQLNTDCVGVILLLLKELQCHSFDLNLKAFQLFDYIEANLKYTNKIHHLQKGMILGWRKKTPPKNGDTGHFTLIYGDPKEIEGQKAGTREFEIQVFEVTKNGQGPRLHHLLLRTEMDGTLKSVCWQDTKWKETRIIAAAPFSNHRLYCPRCAKVTHHCLCSLLPTRPWASPRISILRHPSEKQHALNSVEIIKRSFKNLSCHDAEILAPDVFPTSPILIYPSENSIAIEELSSSQLSHSSFILLDGTWKKTRKMIYLNSWLNDIPHVHMTRKAPPLYKIRKGPSNEHYSTLEIFSELWQRIAPKETFKAKRLEEIFSLMIDNQLREIGPEKYQHNYRHYPGFQSNS